MRGIKPFKLSFLTRPFQWGPTCHLGVGVLAYARLGEPELFTDFEMWKDAAEVLGPDLILDQGLPKSRSEFLVAGRAHQPGGVPGTVRMVRVGVGQLEKSINVVGDRFWRNGVPTEPAPFTEMSLGWENAFGGTSFPRNPRGKGAEPIRDEQGHELHPLPNLELPGRMITSPKDKPEPASLGSIDFMWPQRFSLAGTYDKRWLDTRFPGFAEDLDWRIWNLAAEDQQQAEPFVGDELVVCEHVHPTKPRLEGRLPGLQARCFVLQWRGGAKVFEEVPLRLTTVWVLPAIERLVLVFHGAHPIAEDDGADVEALMVAGERIGAPRPIEHYQAVLEKRSGANRALEVLNDADLVPAEWCGMGPDVDEQMTATTPENLLHARQRRAAEANIEAAREEVRRAGLNPDEHGPVPLPPDEPVPPMGELAGFVERKMQEGKELMARAEKDRQESRAKMAAFYAEAGLDFDEVIEEMRTGPRGPPTFDADQERARFRALADTAAAAGHPVDELEHFATDAEIYARWKKREQDELDLYRRTAHLQAPAFLLPEAVARERRAFVEATHRQGASMAGWDLTGADLSGLDLREANLEGALLESADLRGAVLDRANLGGAVLAHANLAQASLSGADLQGANLGSTIFAGARLAEARLTDALLTGVDLRGADLTRAAVGAASFRSGHLEGARFHGANLVESTFLEVSLVGVDFQGADLTRATFVKAVLDGLDLSGTSMEDATLVETRGVGVKLVNARLVGLRCVLECSLEGSDFRGADLTRANLRGVNLARSDLSGARLTNADLSTANLSEARLYRIVARQSLWLRTDLRGAFLVSADLFEAILEKADLRGADLRGANLYGADFALVHTDAGTNVEDAIQDRVRILPLRAST